MKKFTDLVFTPNQHSGGVSCRLDFQNGYGASIVQSEYSYGGSEGLYEIAVLKEGSICYDTPITSDVLGYLNENDVIEIINSIEALPSDK